jgi:1,4-alpha-glucan branching enzyme
MTTGVAERSVAALLWVFDLPARGGRARIRGMVSRTVPDFPGNATCYVSPVLTEQDIYLFRQGTHFRAYEKLGAHPVSDQMARGTPGPGTHFGVWAPNAARVSVVGDFNEWRADAHPMQPHPDSSGIWTAYLPGVRPGALYKYHIVSKHADYNVEKSDPFAFYCETPPRTASVVWDLSYEWGDGEWMQHRARANALDAPWSVYEVHIASWRRVAEERNRSLTYRELAHALGDYVADMGYTHVELMPVMEHPFFGSWGYQVTGYFAPSSRYGTPQDFMYLVDQLHRRGIGVILDWVPSHFPADEHGLGYFDGTHLYEHADPRQGFHPEWNSSIFNYGRAEVRNFLASNALFWLDKYHADGLRVDAVASMLYLDYAREPGEWIPNRFGGHENLDAVAFLKNLNEAVYRDYPDTQTIAEESTAWPMVSRPTHLGGLGFGLKWNMGWMHDTLEYFQTDPIHRKFHHNKLTFGAWYAFTENFVLPLSHDEVVHGKGSLIGKMPGDEWQQFANLRLLFGYMWGHPGKQLLFMGGEFGQRREWQHEEGLEWYVLQYPFHAGAQRWMRDLNHFYRATPALYRIDFNPEGFEWIDCNDTQASVLSFLRKGTSPAEVVLVVCNFTPVPRDNYQVGVPRGGRWRERLNSDARDYGGSGTGNLGGVEAAPLASHGRYYSLTLYLPPLSALYLTPE